jgi:hypothetical protein
MKKKRAQGSLLFSGEGRPIIFLLLLLATSDESAVSSKQRLSKLLFAT